MDRLFIRLADRGDLADKLQSFMKSKKWKGQAAGEYILEQFFSEQEEPKKEVAVKRPRAPVKRFVKPEWAELAQYFHEQGSATCQDDATAFIDHYEANGWKVGKNSMKDWKATVRTWMKRKKENVKQSGSKAVSGRDAITFRDTDF